MTFVFSNKTGSGIRRREFELLVLYSCFFFYLAAVFSQQEGNRSYFISSTLSIFMMFLYLYTFCPSGTVKINLKLLFLTTCLLILIIFSPYSTFAIYPAIFYIYILSIVIFIQNSNISTGDFVKVLNKIYSVYLLFSIAQYFQIFPQLRETINAFDVAIASFTVKTLYGLEGSTAHIDSFSGLILLTNIFLNQSKTKVKYIALSCFCMLWTFRLTPLISMVISTISFFIVRDRKVAIMLLMTIMMLWVGSLYCLINDYYVMSILNYNFNLNEILYKITHARSMIWEIHLKYLFSNYDIIDFICGNFGDNFNLQLLTPDGYSISKSSDNAHNSYLSNFYQAPFLSVLFYFCILGSIWKNFERKSFVIILFIIIVAYMNSTIFSIYNPVFLLSIIYLSLGNPNKVDCRTSYNI